MSQATELEYLRFVYNSLDLETLIEIYKNFPDIPPKEYSMYLCVECRDNPAQSCCVFCNKNLCDSCVYTCDENGLMLCKEHFPACPVCDVGCACTMCRKYNAEYMCTVCSDNYDVEYSCKNCSTDINRCVMCKYKIDPITKERI